MKTKYIFITRVSYLILILMCSSIVTAQLNNNYYYKTFYPQKSLEYFNKNIILGELQSSYLFDIAFADTISDTTKSIADMDLLELSSIKISPFDVSTIFDYGYRASNSVSGSRFDTPIQELPFAIQAFTESFIIDQFALNIFDVARYSPGVTYRSNDFNEGNANLAIRGFAISSTAGNVQILRDGFHGPSIFDFTNISRVEVVKGPSSFLYGQVAPGGIVNIITKTPQPNFAVNTNISYGSYYQYRFDTDVTGPISNSLYYRLAASYNKDMQYWKPYDAYSRVFAPSLLWKLNDRISITLKYENFLKDETPQVMQKPGYNTQHGVVPTPSDPNLSGVDVPSLPDNWNSMSFADYRKSNTSNLSTWIDFKISDNWNLRTGYSHLNYEIDAIFSGNLGMANNTTMLQGRRFRKQTYSNRDDNLEVQLGGKYTFELVNLRLLMGVQYVNRNFNNWAAQAPNDTSLGTNPTASPLPLWDLRDPSTWNRVVNIPLSALTENRTDQSTKFEDKSIYAGTTLSFWDERLLILAGWRLTLTESQLTNNLTNLLQPKSTARVITPQYGLLYKFTPGLSVYASYAESFVPGTQILNLPDGLTKPAEPTRGSGYDIGIKSDLFENYLSSTITYFDIRNENIVNDIAVTNSLGSVVIYNVQSGEQRSQGVELDVTATMMNNWQLYFSYSYMNARIIEFSGNDQQILNQNPYTLDAAGQTNYKNVLRFHNAPLQMSAPHITNFWSRYNFSDGLFKNLHVAGGVNYIFDQTLLPDAPKSAHQTYAIVNLIMGYRFDLGKQNIRVELIGKNLLNEHYRPSQSTRSRPREFLLSINIEF
jgi:iron complex outermembrane recepter protein